MHTAKIAEYFSCACTFFLTLVSSVYVWVFRNNFVQYGMHVHVYSSNFQIVLCKDSRNSIGFLGLGIKDSDSLHIELIHFHRLCQNGIEYPFHNSVNRIEEEKGKK